MFQTFLNNRNIVGIYCSGHSDWSCTLYYAAKTSYSCILMKFQFEYNFEKQNPNAQNLKHSCQLTLPAEKP